MPTATARTDTANASRYLQQLCKHWGHRFEVVFDPHKGEIIFAEGQKVELVASENALEVTIHADGPDDLDKLEPIVAEHLKRFAFRENLEFNWQRAA